MYTVNSVLRESVRRYDRDFMITDEALIGDKIC